MDKLLWAGTLGNSKLDFLFRIEHDHDIVYFDLFLLHFGNEKYDQTHVLLQVLTSYVQHVYIFV